MLNNLLFLPAEDVVSCFLATLFFSILLEAPTRLELSLTFPLSVSSLSDSAALKRNFYGRRRAEHETENTVNVVCARPFQITHVHYK